MRTSAAEKASASRGHFSAQAPVGNKATTVARLVEANDHHARPPALRKPKLVRSSSHSLFLISLVPSPPRALPGHPASTVTRPSSSPTTLDGHLAGTPDHRTPRPLACPTLLLPERAVVAFLLFASGLGGEGWVSKKVKGSRTPSLSAAPSISEDVGWPKGSDRPFYSMPPLSVSPCLVSSRFAGRAAC